MLIEEEKVEIVEDENIPSTKEKKKKEKKKGKKKEKKLEVTPSVEENNEDVLVSTENEQNETSENEISEDQIDNIYDETTENKNKTETDTDSDTNIDVGEPENIEKAELPENASNIESDENSSSKVETQNDNIVENNKAEENTSEENFVKTDEETLQEEDKAKSKKAISIIFIILGILLALFIIVFGAFSIYNYKNKNVIAKGVSVDSIDVSYCTKEQAKEKITSYYNEKLANDIKLVYNDYQSFIKPAEIELTYDIDSSVEYAFSYGKNGNIFQDNYHVLASMINNVNITPVYTLNQELLTKFLTNVSTELPDAIIESSHFIEDNKLIITKGKSGSVVNTELTSNNIKSKLPSLAYIDNPITIEVTTQNPKEINVDEIYNEIHKEPKDAYYTKNPYTVFPSENGIDFKVSIDEAKQIVQSAEAECEIPLKVLYPKVTTNMIGQEAFPDLLGSFSTNYVSNPDRTTNLRLAANKINGKVLMPGEVFSYNGIVGARTAAAGYKNAAIYQDGEVVDGIGGGICQISSTLYNAALFANLEMVELHNHQFVPSYVKAGRDATVVYGVKDFKFKNSRNYAIKITCSVSGGVAEFKIWGVKEPTEYDVSVYANVSRTDSYIKATTYRTLKQNGATVKTERIANSTYKVH